MVEQLCECMSPTCMRTIKIDGVRLQRHREEAEFTAIVVRECTTAPMPDDVLIADEGSYRVYKVHE
jgi:hypothetical protein